MDMLKIGVASSDITPAVGTELYGHFRSDLRSTGIHSNLYAKALVLDDGGEKAVMVACDLCAVSADFVVSARERIEGLTGINGKNVMISCTHTHSGPGSMFVRVVGKIDEAYLDQLAKKIAGTIYLASRNAKAASIGLGVGMEQLAASRRVKWPDGSIRFDWLDPHVRPKEPIDDELKVFTARDGDGKAIAVVVNYACHPTTMSGNSFNLISSDFPGVATSVIERAEGDGTMALFFNGAFGDTQPRNDLVPDHNIEVKGDEITQTLGTLLGAAALRLSKVTSTSPGASIQVRSETIRAPLEKVPTEGEIEGLMQTERQRLLPSDAGERFWLKIKLDWYDFLLEQYGRKFNTYEDLEVQVMRIGDTYLVGLPGEVFSHIGLEIKSRAHKLGTDKVIVIALANGCPGYVPAEEDYTIAPLGKRGYELEGSYMLDGRPLVASGTSPLMIEAAVRLIEKTKA
jgi:neutral ceramidase